MSRAREVLKRVTPVPMLEWYRRQRAKRHYLTMLSWELVERETRLDFVEGRVAARRDGFYERMVKDVLERTEIILQDLDRRIEGLQARTNERLEDLLGRVEELRSELGALRRDDEGPSPTALGE